ncbi:hypothetical protein D9M68_797730 [compost metagenome]
MAAEQGVRGHVEQRGYGEQQGDGAVGFEQVAAGAVEQQQADEGAAGQDAEQCQPGPQAEVEDHDVDHCPQGGEHGKQEGEQPHAVDDHGCPTLVEQR